MKKLSFLLFLSILLSLLPALPASAAVPDVELSAQGIYLYNLDTDQMIYEKNGAQKMYPASTTKIMTCILALEHTEDLDSVILTYPDYIQDYLYNYQYVEGHGEVSKGGLLAGEELPMREALYALMLPSANEVAMIIADHIAGSQEGFAEMMNTRAKELGAKNTNFVNANGLFDENHYTTPEDMALITMHALTLPGFTDIVTTTTYTCSPTNKHESLTWETTNWMMVESSSYYYAPVKGIKTGYLPEAGRCLVSTATKDGYTYLAVVMNSSVEDAENRLMHFTDTENLYDWVFRTYKQKTLLQKGATVSEIPLKLSSERDYLQLMTAERFNALVPTDVDVKSVRMVYSVPDSVKAPVSKYDVIGSVTLMLDGEEIGIVELQAAETVNASTPLVILDKVRDVMSSFWFKFALIFFLLLVVAYIVLMIIRNRNRQRFGNYKPRRRI